MSDNIEHPFHYNNFEIKCSECDTQIECLDVINDMPFLEGNIIKYVWRWRDKNGIEDLRKAMFYLDYLITKNVYVRKSEDDYI